MISVLLLAACSSSPPSTTSSAAPAPPLSPPREACQPAASPYLGELSADLVVLWGWESGGQLDGWRVLADGRFQWVYTWPLPLSERTAWRDGPALGGQQVADLRALLASELPGMVSAAPDQVQGGWSGLEAPGVGSAWAAGPCEVRGMSELLAGVDAILDADGRPRTSIRNKAHHPDRVIPAGQDLFVPP